MNAAKRALIVSLMAGVGGMGVGAAMAQEGAKAPDVAKAITGPDVDPAAKDLIDKCRAAIRDVKDISCGVDAASTVDGQTEKTTGKVWMVIERLGVGRGTQMKMFKMEKGTSDTMVAQSFDGKTAMKVDAAKKTVWSVSAEGENAYPLQEMGPLVPSWVMGDVLMQPAAVIIAAKLLPDAEVAGVKCKVVDYTVEVKSIVPDDVPSPEDAEEARQLEAARKDPPRMLLKQVRSIGEDLMPRKIESKVSYSGAYPTVPSGREFTGTFSDLKVNQSPAADVFAMKVPDGYTQAKADAGDVGLPSNDQPKLAFAAGDVAPAFALKDPSGKEVTLASLKGRVVLLDFWATWCGPCKAAMPSIQKIHEKFADKPVSILGVNTWERGKPDGPQKYMESKKFTYGLLMKGDDLAKTYGISGIPTLVLIGPDGKILHIGVGFSAGEEAHLTEMIEKAIPQG